MFIPTAPQFSTQQFSQLNTEKMPENQPAVNLAFGQQQHRPARDQVTLSDISETSKLPEDMLVSSRPKPRQGWKNQDRIKVSLLDKEIKADNLRNAYRKAARETASLAGGSTGTTMIVTPSKIHVAWLGDSPAFLVGLNPKTGAIEQVMGLNEPHIPLRDIARIKAKGGRVEEGRLVKPGAAETPLSMSHSFGDSWLGNILGRQADIVTVERTSLTSGLIWYGVVGSDGIVPDSEYNLLFPRKDGSRIIDHVARLFEDLLKESWRGQRNWAEAITTTAQEKLKELQDSTPEPRRFDDAVVDDTSLIIVPVSGKPAGSPYSYVATVADGHRDGGEITAQKVINTIHDALK